MVARRGRAVTGNGAIHRQLRGREQPGVVDQPAEQVAAHVRHRFQAPSGVTTIRPFMTVGWIEQT